MPSCVELTIENIHEIGDPYNAFVNSVRNSETLRKYQNQLHVFLKLIPDKIYADVLGKTPGNDTLEHLSALFDVHCQLQYQSNGVEIEKNHDVICVDHHPKLPPGIKDEDIGKFAKENGYTIVTKDVDFVNYCKSENISVGVLKGNQLYLIEDSIQLFGEQPPNRLFTQD